MKRQPHLSAISREVSVKQASSTAVIKFEAMTELIDTILLSIRRMPWKI